MPLGHIGMVIEYPADYFYNLKLIRSIAMKLAEDDRLRIALSSLNHVGNVFLIRQRLGVARSLCYLQQLPVECP